MFKIDDRVRCIDDKGISNLVLGETYTVLRFCQDCVMLYSSVAWYDANRFVLATSSNSNLPTGVSIARSSVVTDVAGDIVTWGNALEKVYNNSTASAVFPEYKCECGTDKIGGGKHSDYCPKYMKS